ncbi:MAG: hypothetical protein Q4C55_03165 [Eubacterium sp.]|nr:hypothetical protein [Eubacterium sp.]
MMYYNPMRKRLENLAKVSEKSGKAEHSEKQAGTMYYNPTRKLLESLED